MVKVTHYKVVQEMSAAKLGTSVNALLDKGWTIWGQIIRHNGFLLQTVIKKDFE